MEQKGFIGEEYDRYDRPRSDIEFDLAMSAPEIPLKPEKDLSMWQKMGKHFATNAGARDKLFQILGSTGERLTRPIQPGEEGTGLIRRLTEGVIAGEEKYAATQAAQAKMMLDRATAMQKANPLQWFSTKMKEARTMVPEGIHPDSAEGIK
jgi:hypothetical protein